MELEVVVGGVYFSAASLFPSHIQRSIMPPRIPKGLSKKKKTVPAPVTVEDFLDCGVEQEENGDRWIDSGDIPKALRFYQKAFGFYDQAILGRTTPGNSKFVNDAAFNVARMQYVIYSKVVKTGLLEDVDQKTLAETYHVVPKDLEAVARAHALALEISQGEMQVDLLYTNGQVLAELGEDLEDLSLLEKAIDSFQQVLEYQLSEAKKSVIEVEETSSGDNGDGANATENATEKTEEISVGEVVTPSSIVETIIATLDCFDTVLELCRDEQGPFISSTGQSAEVAEAAIAGIHVLVQEFFGIINQFGVEGTEDGRFTSVALDLAQETAIKFAQVLSTCAESVDVLVAIWTTEISPSSVPILEKVLGHSQTITLPETPEKYLAASDSLIGYTERTGIPVEAAWTAFAHASSLLKKAWEMSSTSPVTIRLQILIARGDVDLLRSKLALPVAEKNLAVLQKNAINMYTSAVNLPLTSGMSLSSGGTAAKLLKREATVKQLLSQGKEEEARNIKGFAFVEI